MYRLSILHEKLDELARAWSASIDPEQSTAKPAMQAPSLFLANDIIAQPRIRQDMVGPHRVVQQHVQMLANKVHAQVRSSVKRYHATDPESMTSQATLVIGSFTNLTRGVSRRQATHNSLQHVQSSIVENAAESATEQNRRSHRFRGASFVMGNNVVLGNFGAHDWPQRGATLVTTATCTGTGGTNSKLPHVRFKQQNPGKRPASRLWLPHVGHLSCTRIAKRQHDHTLVCLPPLRGHK